MKISILMNGRDVVRSWHAETPVHPEVRETGSGPALGTAAVEALVAELRALIGTLPATDDGRRQFDQQAARLLAQRLPLPLATASDRRFWQWFSITRAQDVVLWRWKKSSAAAVSEDRWLGGWKDTFRRLWLRANLIREEGAADPYALALIGDEDFWVGIVERDIAACRTVVRALVRRFFAPDAADTGSSQKMLHYRATLKRLRQIRPNRVYEQISDAEAVTLIQDTVSATIPPDGPSSGRRPRTAKSKKKTRKSGKKPVRR
jgi:hypothetical protein